MLKLFISKSKNLDEKEATVLAILNGMYSNKHDDLIASLKSIGYMACGRLLNVSIQRDRTILQNIKVGIKSLAEREIITILEQDNDTYVISNKGLEVDAKKDKFVVVELWELQKIFAESNKPFNVFDFFLNLVGTIKNTTKEWHMSQDEMVSFWGYSKRTVNDYLEQLENMQLIYVYRHKKRRADGTYYKINNSYGRYADKDMVIAEARKYADTVECEDFCEKTDRRAIKLRYNACCNGAKKYKNDTAAQVELYKECLLYNKSLKYKPVEGSYDGEWKQGELLDLSVFPDDVINQISQNGNSTDHWGEADPLEKEFTVEEMLDMPTLGEVTNSDLQSEGGKTKTFGLGNIDSQKSDSPKMDSEEIGCDEINTTYDDLWETDSVEEIDIDKIVLSEEEAWELFA